MRGSGERVRPATPGGFGMGRHAVAVGLECFLYPRD